MIVLGQVGRREAEGQPHVECRHRQRGRGRSDGGERAGQHDAEPSRLVPAAELDVQARTRDAGDVEEEAVIGLSRQRAEHRQGDHAAAITALK